jgi:nucleoside-diphosphate-sugar epimerase
MLARATPTVLVTGGSGRVGKYVVRELINHAYQVLNVDLRPSALAETIIADATDLESLLGVSGTFDALIHLAAIPSMRNQPPQEVC